MPPSTGEVFLLLVEVVTGEQQTTRACLVERGEEVKKERRLKKVYEGRL
jgi:hypothetical protein